jgi:hypothetical protein
MLGYTEAEGRCPERSRTCRIDARKNPIPHHNDLIGHIAGRENVVGHVIWGCRRKRGGQRFSYSREDDEDSNNALSALRDRIQRELRSQLGRSIKTFRLWQDKEAIASGKLWEAEMTAAVAESVFFIPIITPTAVQSPHCRFELEAFLAREVALDRDDLVFPIPLHQGARSRGRCATEKRPGAFDYCQTPIRRLACIPSPRCELSGREGDH